MRHFTFKMTKAAHKRLSLLSENDELPLPLMPDQIAPFWFRRSGPFLAITHEGKDIAYVSDQFTEDGKSVFVMTPIPDSTTVDMAVCRTLYRITEHLNGVGRILAQEAKERKAEQDEARRLKEEKQRNAPDPLIGLKNADGTPAADAIGTLFNMTPEDMEYLSRAGTSPDFPFITGLRSEKELRLHCKQGDVRILSENDTLRVAENSIGVSIAKLNTLLVKEIDWCRANNNVALITQALDALPPPDVSIIAYHLRPSRPKNAHCPDLELPNEVTARFTPYGIKLERQGADIGAFDMPHAYGLNDVYHIPPTAQACVRNNWHGNAVFDENISMLTESHYMRLGAAWLRAMASVNPEMDLAQYALPDPARVEAEAQRWDMGYDC